MPQTTTNPKDTQALDQKLLLAALQALRKGDFSVRLPQDGVGMTGKIYDALNDIIDMTAGLNGEMSRIADVVGREGRLGQRARLPAAQGGWSHTVESLNSLITDLAQPTSDLTRVIGAVARGDLTQTMSIDIDGRPLKGEFLRNARMVNSMVEQLSSFASEVTRVAREVGTEGKLGGQAHVKGVSGTWKDLTDSVNSMASNLTAQVRNIADVTKAVANGNLSRKITVDVRGEILELKDTINTMVDQLQSFASEVTRVAREVGTEGKLGGQARVEGVAGTWRDLTDSVNGMASNLTAQVRNIADVTKAVAAGDLSRKITVDVKGEILELKDTINTMVDQLSSFAAEVTRVAREVGTEGKLGGQAKVEGVAGTWRDLTDSVNGMASNLTAQVRNIADVTKAVAAGDLSRKITVDVKGEILELKNTINTMVDQLRSFASEVTRVAREVGTEGKLGGQARVEGVAGTWRDLTDNVNSMAQSLTVQVRNIAEVTKAVASGDLSRKITVEAQGEIVELKTAVNTMVDQLRSFASEVTRVAREVAIEGKLGGQAEVEGVAGVWRDLTNNVNMLASNLTAQVRNIADVTKAVAAGDLSRKITVDVRGEILELKNTINVMVDQLSSFAAEVTRVAREVGTEGKLGGQAKVEGVAGTWRDLTDSVNGMASNLTAQVRNIADVTKAVAAGDLSRKITVDVKGEILELKNTINVMVDQLSSFASEVTRVAREVGTEGKLGGQARVEGVAGTWKDLTESVNFMASNLTDQVRNIADVTKAVAAGDLSRKITVDVRGEILELKETINTMVDQLSSFSAEVIRVAREVGTEGKLGGQAQVKGVAGAWRDLTENVNFMASNLTNQVRGIAAVVTAVANGDLKRKLSLEARGEIAALADTINAMIDTLATFAQQVTTVAREVGIEGKLGGQARVPSAAGTWRDLTDNVNSMAQSLTVQVRAIAEVATAVAQGDLSRSIQVAAQGEVAALKDNINQMIANLRETTRKNTEQDWLKTNIARLTRMLQGQRDMDTVSRQILKELAPLVRAQTGALYLLENGANEEQVALKLVASYAFKERKQLNNKFKPGEGLIGQVVLEKERILLTDVPGDYIRISSGLGDTRPLNLVVVPVLFEGEVRAVIELASLYPFTDTHLSFLDQLTESIGVVLNTIAASSRTEELLRQSQGMAEELRAQQAELTETNKQLEAQARTLQASEERLRQQQEELQQTNEELEERSRMLQLQNAEVERKNREIENAKKALEEKAEQLALTSRYKSEFLANMSHELRTPLNSLLILSKLLSENSEGNLSDKQVEFARTINTAGSDLLALINDILDLSKIESGMMTLDVEELDLLSVRDQMLRTFREVANGKGLKFDFEAAPELPRTMFTDARRLQQVLKNLLSNAFKFTEHGGVTLKVEPATSGWNAENAALNGADQVLAFSVVDTGIGIPKEKQAIIFEAFQQADGTTNRKYGGTGLGLSISRELAKLLGGELKVTSEVGTGSTFTLFLPRTVQPAARGGRGNGGNGASSPRNEQPLSARADDVVELPEVAPEEVDPALLSANELHDDRDQIEPQDRVLLVVEDDPGFARLLLELAREAGFRGIVALRGDVGLALARRYEPDAITLDIRLPAVDGWAVLDRLKHDPRLRHIPVHIISGSDDDRQRGLQAGAMTVLNKPVERDALSEALKRTREFIERPLKTLLVVEDDERQRSAILNLIGNGDVKSIPVGSAQEALKAVHDQYIDCVVLDLGLPDMNGIELVQRLRQETRADLPIIVYTGRDLTEEQETQLRRLADSIIVKSARSPEHLLDETSLFLHRVESNLPETKRKMLRQAQFQDPQLAGRKVLVVDDDARNLFAIASILERYHVNVLFAENGRKAVELVDANPDLSVVLMDVMMPEMDGYETMRAIREKPAHQDLPIIAVTAKAMKDDREKCIEAGASDYITKPVDPDQLVSLLRVWAYRRRNRVHRAEG